MKVMALALALGVAASISFAKEDADTTAPANRTQVTTSTASNDAASSAAAAEAMKRGNAMMDEAYKAAGLSQETIDQLRDLQSQAREAKGDPEKVKQLREQRRKLITPEQMKQVTEHIRSQMPKPTRRRGASPDVSATTETSTSAKPGNNE